MTGKEMYEIHREQASRLNAIDRGSAPLVPWEELHPKVQMHWEQAAIDQTERDLEPGAERELNTTGLEV